MIAVIIVGYNSQRFLKTCLTSLQKSNTPHTVIFVDNASTDNSVAYIKEHFPKTLLIESKKNLGFAGANNLGIEKALELNASAVFLLNPDTAVAPDCLSILQQNLNETELLQPAILLDPEKQTNLINTTGGVLSILGFSYCSDYKVPIEDLQTAHNRAIASGAAVVIPTSILKKIGLLDETFFMYHEDVDLAWRAKLAGYTIKLLPQAKVWHDYSFSRNATKLYYAERNRLIFLLKNFSLRYWILMLPLLALTELAICLYFAKDGLLPEKLKGYQEIINRWSAIQKQRERVQKLRTVSDRELAPLLADRVQFSEVDIPLLKPYNLLVNLYWKIVRPLL